MAYIRKGILCDLELIKEKTRREIALPKKNGKGPREDSKGARDGKGRGTGNASGEGIGKKKGGKKGKC